MTEARQTVRLKVSPEVARIVTKTAPRDLQLAAARGAVPLQGRDLVTALLFLANSRDEQIRQEAVATLRNLPVGALRPVAGDHQAHPQLLDFIARHRSQELPLMELLLVNPSLPDATLISLAGRCEGVLLSLIANNDERLIQAPDIINAILDNPHADRALKFRFGWKDPDAASEETPPASAPQPEVADLDGDEPVEEDEEHLSKYQEALEFGVADKIKYALTGDKEWRAIFLKDPNKLVHSAVMKNPRITEGEVLMVAKNRTASDELIRLINLNREWVKNYEIRKALVMHPKTPLPKALRYMNTLGDKEIKELSKSRNVSQIIVNNARRMLMAKEKKNR